MDNEPIPPDHRFVGYTRLSPHQLAAFIERHQLGVRLDDVHELSRTGAFHTVYALGEQLVLRAPKDHPQAIAETYTAVVAAPVAHRAGVATPDLVVFDPSGAAEVVASVYLDHQGLGAGPVKSVEGYVHVVRTNRSAYESQSISIEDLFEAGDRAAARIRWRGRTHRGEDVDRQTIDIVRVVGAHLGQVQGSGVRRPPTSTSIATLDGEGSDVNRVVTDS